MEAVFTTALERRGRAYLEAEEELRAGGAPAIATLQRHLADKDGLSQLIARVILAWATGKAPSYPKAVEKLDAMAAESRQTPAGAPSPTGVAHALTKSFGDSVVEVLAVRLLKAVDWPRWKTLGVLLYLQAHPAEPVAPALVSFVVHEPEKEALGLALKILAKLPDPVRRDLLHQEKARLQDMRRTMPEAVERLLQP